jgi:TolB-like protein
VEDIITALSRFRSLFAIARNSSFTYKGKAVDIKQVGSDANSACAMCWKAPSNDVGGNRLRVNVQLIDAETGNHLWAERFDKPFADLFDMQDEIVSRLANALDAELVAAEARRAERLLHPDATDLYFQGMAYTYKGLTNEYLAQARGFFERALALDPDHIQALVGSAGVDFTRASMAR